MSPCRQDKRGERWKLEARIGGERGGEGGEQREVQGRVIHDQEFTPQRSGDWVQRLAVASKKKFRVGERPRNDLDIGECAVWYCAKSIQDFRGWHRLQRAKTQFPKNETPMNSLPFSTNSTTTNTGYKELVPLVWVKGGGGRRTCRPVNNYRIHNTVYTARGDGLKLLGLTHRPLPPPAAGALVSMSSVGDDSIQYKVAGTEKKCNGHRQDSNELPLTQTQSPRS
ncbi:hypothetical protein J6590_027907 [Homalodisca vitripennis]|nr:hypothetical protein J6590_027907 [Homalodisca vitripennis]